MRIDRADMTGLAADPVDDLLARFAVAPEVPMWDVLAKIDFNGEGIALVVDGDRRLRGLVTDGDIRRAILAHADFERPVEHFLEAGIGRRWAETLSAPVDAAASELLTLMEVRLVRHLPLLDEDGRIAGLALKQDLQAEPELPMRAVVMAGGLGTRLRPLTEDTPKPLLPVGDKPVIEHIVSQLRDSGVRKVSITAHYQADKIREHFGDGDDFGVEVSYTHEEEPMGTAGALAMVEESDEPILVINGDILTAVDFRAMLDFHRDQQADITVAVRKYDLSVPFGVIEADGPKVTALAEKPVVSHFINAGIYLLEPRLLDMIPGGERTDMTDLIQKLLAGEGTVVSFPIHEYWIDIGQMRDYMRAQADAAAGKLGS